MSFIASILLAYVASVGAPSGEKVYDSFHYHPMFEFC